MAPVGRGPACSAGSMLRPQSLPARTLGTEEAHRHVDPDKTHPIDIKHVLRVLRSHAWMIALLVIVACIGTYGLSKTRQNVYQATSSVKITNSNTSNVFFAQNEGSDIARQVATEAAVLQSKDLRNAVDGKMGDRASLIDKVTVAVVPDTDVVSISVASTSPEVARDAANAFAEVYVAQRKESAARDLHKNGTELRARAEAMDAQLQELDLQIRTRPLAETEQLRVQRNALTVQRDDFRNRANQFDVQASVLSGNVDIADTAQLPVGPVSPNPRRDAQIAAVAALLLGIALVLLLDLLDDRITSPDDLEAATGGGLPLLGSLPIYTKKKKRGARRLPHGRRHLVPLNSMDAEVYRTIRTNLRFSNLAKQKRVIAVTSASGSEGKSTFTANLAVSMAEGGQRVVVISGDLRRPVVSSLFSIDETKTGLTTVLLGEDSLKSCLVPVDLESGHKLYVLPSGPIPPNPAELLGSRAMSDLLNTLKKADVDFILIDCPPVLPVSDPLALAQYTDGVILLTVVGQTLAHHLHEACDRLRRVDADIIGVVLNGIPTAGGRYPYYYYRRYSYKQYDTDFTTEGPLVQPQTSQSNGSSNGSGGVRVGAPDDGDARPAE